jgi:hypothetical protein
LPGDHGHVAAALVMGDQGGIAESTQEAMRASGLGHFLSISGLHMALVAPRSSARCPRQAGCRPIRNGRPGRACRLISGTAAWRL